MLSLLLAAQLLTLSEALDLAEQASPRLDRLQQWVGAVEEHDAATADESVDRIRTWTRDDLEGVGRDLRSLLTLIWNPKQSVFYTVPTAQRNARTQNIFYTRRELEALRALAAAARARGDFNRLLKRGALLHTDIAIFAPSNAIAAQAGRAAPLHQITLRMDDGRQLGVSGAVGHWQMAARLLNEVTPNPEQDDRPKPSTDDAVRRWYRATTAFMLAAENYVLPHFQRAHQLFPDDGTIQFLVGSAHETLAGARTQAAVGSVDLRGLDFPIQSERDELRLAEASLRRSLMVMPNLAEARIRLGRVIGLQGRPAEAVKELRAAVSATKVPMLLYHGELFLGRELEMLKQFDAARDAYERAAALYPYASSPKIALSQLASRTGNRALALASMHEALEADSSDDHEDPRWAYHLQAGRFTQPLLDEMIEAFPPRIRP